MKQTAKMIGFLTVLLALSSLAWGRGTPGVKNTIHNLSSSSTYFMYQSDNVDEICVFCHTPHGGVLNGPLWNRSLPDTGSFTHYNSASLSPYLQGMSVARNVNDESLICLSCHDGSVAINHLLNDPNSLNGSDITYFFGAVTETPGLEMPDMFGGIGSRIGASLNDPSGTGDLSDDHPISFSYSQVLAEPIYDGGSRDGELRPVGNTGDASSALGYKGEGVRFFGSDYRVECSSCHDPHVDYISGVNNPKNYTPFLIRPNSGSDLCLSCHNK